MVESHQKMLSPLVTSEEVASHLDIAVSGEQDFLDLFQSGPLRRLADAPLDVRKRILSLLSARKVQRVLLELAFVVKRVEHTAALIVMEKELQQLKRNMLQRFQPRDLSDVEAWTQWKKKEEKRKPVDLFDLTNMTQASRAKVGKV
jgi:hypothetical protein